MKEKESSESKVLVMNNEKEPETGAVSNGDLGISCGADELETKAAALALEPAKNVKKKLSPRDRLKLGDLLRDAINSSDWERATRIISAADSKFLNAALFICSESIWFLSTKAELYGITGLIKKVVADGASVFAAALFESSFFASFVSACYRRTLSVAETLPATMERSGEMLREFVDVLKPEAGSEADNFCKWVLKTIKFHLRCHRNNHRVLSGSLVESQLQLSAFREFLNIASDHLTSTDLSDALQMACFPHRFYSSKFVSGWASHVSSTTIRGVVSMLVDAGATTLNQCFHEASRFGSTEFVRMLLQISRRNGLEVDVDVNLALFYASFYGRFSTMELLVEEGGAVVFIGPLKWAAEIGYMPILRWFVERGCGDMDLCIALIVAASRSRIEAAAYLLPRVPHYILDSVSAGVDVIKVAGDMSSGCLDGVAFLLRSDFLRDPGMTYAVAERIVTSSDSESERVVPELRAFLREEWSEKAFLEGVDEGEVHFSKVVRFMKWADSNSLPISCLPAELRVAIAYLPLYREVVAAGGSLLSQRHRGQLVVAARKLGGVVPEGPGHRRELLAALERRLPTFFVR